MRELGGTAPQDELRQLHGWSVVLVEPGIADLGTLTNMLVRYDLVSVDEDHETELQVELCDYDDTPVPGMVREFCETTTLPVESFYVGLEFSLFD